MTDTPELRGQKSGAVSYPFEAINTPMQSTFEFTLVDSAGVRSEPKRIVLEVVSPPRAAPSGCTSATCGRVVAVSEIKQPAPVPDFRTAIKLAFSGALNREATRSQKTYAITVRMDNGKTQVLRQNTPWRSGARVRVVGNRVAAVNP